MFLRGTKCISPRMWNSSFKVHFKSVWFREKSETAFAYNKELYFSIISKSIILSAPQLQAWKTALYALKTLSLFPWMSTKLDKMKAGEGGRGKRNELGTKAATCKLQTDDVSCQPVLTRCQRGGDICVFLSTDFLDGRRPALPRLTV